MKVVFRVDASLNIGTGHVMRCLTLATALVAKGANCEFLCRAHPGNLIEHIRNNGFFVHSLPMGDQSDRDLPHSSWLGGTQVKDAQLCISKVSKLNPDWLVVDHYGLDSRWEKPLATYCSKILAIDDLADRSHYCNVLLDQNFGSSPLRYSGLLSPECIELHGPRFSLLDPIYASLRKKSIRKLETIKRIFVYFGGVDISDLTGIALCSLCAEELAHIELNIVIGAGYAHRVDLEVATKKRGRAVIHKSLPNLAALMVRADLAIGAGGVTTWERCCMGLPSLVVSVADNQRFVCEALASEGYIDYLGHIDSVDFGSMKSTVNRMRNNLLRLGSLGEAGRKLVDGVGTERVLQVMQTHYFSKLDISNVSQ